MFRNLEAEQSRHNFTDSFVAQTLGISRETYTRKKQSQNFKYKEILQLYEMFNSDFEYLFATEGEKYRKVS